MDLVVGIDLGTTSVKVAAFTPNGDLVRSQSFDHPTARPHDSWAEQDALVWWDICVRGLEAVAAGTVRSVGVVSQVNTHLFVDADLNPLAPAITWQDQRCADVARELDARFTAEDKVRIWGGPFTLDASRLVSRAAWFAAREPEKWARTRWILSPKDFITARLTGRVATDGMSSIGMVDRTGTRYLPEAVALVDGLAERLPDLADPVSPLGTVADPGIGIGSPPVVVGTMDALGTMFGSGLTESGRAMVSCGTSVVVAGASEQRNPTGGVITFPPMGGVFIHAGPTQAGGDALRWWSRVCGMSIDEVVAESAGVPSGVVFTPHLLGERAPLWDSDVRGSFLGLSSATSRPELTRAVLEGVAMSARQVLAEVETACGFRVESLAFSGGGARSDRWSQIFADVLRRPVERLRVRDSTVLAAALLGGVGAGIHPSIGVAAREAVQVERVFVPDAAAAECIDPLYGIYSESYRALGGIHAALREWRDSRRLAELG
ncbi:xylulokinase [Amycolatopsis anabasis]|uniref:xylulokinase n=1 Tax=Amycolatopsis anabasis TaxID=1840409 RepID=UPI00131DC8AA|nr:FGGY-family carbohydrate kinase [Amycolatopsis anabasis]